MTRIATFAQNQFLLQDVLRNERRLFEDQQRVASGFKSRDYKGIARDVATLSGAKTIQKKTETFIESNIDLRRRLEIYDIALQGLFDSADQLRQDLITGVNTSSGIGLRDKINGHRRQSSQYAGERPLHLLRAHRHAGRQWALARSAPAIKAFDNNTIQQRAKIDENQTLTYGVLADGAATELFESIQRLVLFDNGTHYCLLNTRENGRYIFSGTRTDTPAVNATTTTALAALGSGNHAQAFDNNTIQQRAKIDENQTLTYGVLADGAATELFESIQRLVLFDNGTNNFGFTTSGPFANELTDDQRDFLIQELAQITQAVDETNIAVAENGVHMRSLEDAQQRHEADRIFIRVFIGDIQDVNAAEAISQLNLDQLALDASFRVYAQLTRLSLIDFI